MPPPPQAFGIAWSIIYPIIFVTFGFVFLEPVNADIGSSFYRAKTTIETFALIDVPVPGVAEGESGWDSLRWWTQGDSISLF